jgi:glycerophosphoryl diester phosphodiesterase
MTLLTRRAMTTAALAGTFLPGLARAQGKKPIVIAHRGCSGERPEHTALAYERAIEQGCDFIEPDLVPTKDGHLVVRHENEIGGTTDVANHPEFAARKATKTIDGQSLTGWFTEDFTLAELKTLRARERLPQLRPASAAFDGKAQVLTFDEVVAIAKAATQRTGRTIGVYPEMKHPSYFASIGLPVEGRMLDALKRNDLNSATAPVFVQCFEVTPLKTLRLQTRAKLVLLVAGEGGPPDLPGVKYADMVSPEGLKAVAAYADGLGPEKTMVIPQDAEKLLPATSLVKDAHAAGLLVHPWTVRTENYFLPASLRKGDAQSPTYLAQQGDTTPLFKALYAAGVDGVFSDFPGLAATARG